jgi:hypothetical protein
VSRPKQLTEKGMASRLELQPMSTLEMGGNFSAAMFSTYQPQDPEGQAFQAGNHPGGRW